MKNNKEHSFIHYKNTIGTEKSRKNNIKKIRKLWKNSKYRKDKIQSLSGENNSNYLNLNKMKCLRLLAIHKGILKRIPYDFNTFKKYLANYNIDYKIIKIRYDKNGKYIPKQRLIKLNKEIGIDAIKKEIGHNYYKLKRLYTFYNLPFERKWANQFGEFKPGNHIILKIEELKSIDVYNLEVKEFHNFFAGQICVKNSSDSPNFQNIPEHDKQSRKITRLGILPSPGNQLLDVDYKSIEVCISACYHHDPVMIDYINNPKSDMHKDIAKQIFIKSEVSKDERYITKNQFVFPQFYGSYYAECAKNIWRNSKTLPFNNFSKFEKHIRDIENDFWNNRFKIYNEWKEKTWKDFQKKGYIKYHTGFVISGHLKKNDVLNYPIQGSAFHCLLWSLIQYIKFLKENNFKTKAIGQIHDNKISDLAPEEKKDLFSIIRKIMTKDIREYWKWIIVPLDIEAEISEVNGNWNEMRGIEI